MIAANIAQTQYYNRPKDERYDSLPALITAARTEQENSTEKRISAKEVQATVSHPDAGGPPRVQLTSRRTGLPADLTHWSFGQLCAHVKAPATYLRTLPPALLADNLNHGLTHTPPGSDFCALLTRAKDPATGQPSAALTPTIRALTTTKYARVWDAPLLESIAATIANRAPGSWTPPPTWEGGPNSQGGLYRGDRDSFVILVEGGSIVNDPSAGSDGRMYRGLMIRNSEVGFASLEIIRILFRMICGNHMIHGLTVEKHLRRRHVGTGLSVDAQREILEIARAYQQRTASQDEATIRRLIATEIAGTREGVIDELRKIGYSKDDAETAYATCERTETASPRSYWGLIQGTTRASQASGYQDQRLDMDRLAAQLMTRALARVAA